MFQLLERDVFCSYYDVPNGTCVKKIPVGFPCKPDDVCADNAQCSSPLGGLCQCQTEYYQVGMKMMVVVVVVVVIMMM